MTRGFSLIEMMAALVIASIIIAGATGAVISINRFVVDTSRKAVVLDEAKRLEEYLISVAQGAGGGAVRPNAAVLIENATDPAPPAIAPATGGMGCRAISGLPDCDDAQQGADRLTLMTNLTGFPQCAVTGTTGVNLNVGAGSGACCLNDASGGLSSWDGMQAVIVGSAGTASVALNSPNASGGNCRVVAPPGQGSGVLPTALGSVGFPATLVVVQASTYFVDRTTSELKIWNDNDGNGNAAPDELTVVHDAVHDLQLAPGYDGRPSDGILDDRAADDDEFLFNNTTDALFPGNSNFSAVTVSQLTTLQIGVVVGTRSEISGGNEIQLLDRAAPITTPDIYLAQTTSKALLRNLAVFTQ
ncbi:MAG: prepilin-type N-terminal cleavage/methylation domain-containing protein [Deltaproteobacteria bacterium]|nr:prepilin-type N-terminal cleavage/methylation domain-containing protein [Deltaproteobacteria bacterium]